MGSNVVLHLKQEAKFRDVAFIGSGVCCCNKMYTFSNLALLLGSCRLLLGRIADRNPVLLLILSHLKEKRRGLGGDSVMTALRHLCLVLAQIDRQLILNVLLSDLLSRTTAGVSQRSGKS